MNRWLVAMMTLALMLLPLMTTGAGADSSGDQTVTCGPNPSPEPSAADDCMDDSAPDPAWSNNAGGVIPDQTCNVDTDVTKKVYNQEQVFAVTDVSCPETAYNLSITLKVFWTLCKRHDGTTCDLHANTLPLNPDQDGPCNCKAVLAKAVMNAPHPYTRYYWNHSIARRNGAPPFSKWEGPTAITIP